MNDFFEIAYAAASNRLCLFTGTGFSRALTEGKAPGWQELLEGVCDTHLENSDLKEVLFPTAGSNPLRLEEAAQIIEMNLTAQEKNLHEVIANNIAEIEISGDIPNIKDFFSKRCFRVVTTNYDKLSEQLAGSDCQSFSPGIPLPKSSSRVKVFHVHGSVDYPPRMVVTTNDYFNFMNSETYFSRKLSTVLHENTVVVLGYSLGDTNLKNILSDYSGFMQDHSVGSSIFFVSRSSVDQPIRDYYAACYGIRVIDNTDIETFFEKLNSQYPRAEGIISESLEAVEKVLNTGVSFPDDFLKMEDSFTEVVSSLGAIGLSLESPKVAEMFGDIVKKKQVLSGEKGAWEQYEHLASWLINLGSLIDIGGRSLEEPYLQAVQYSMEHMSRKIILGYSWHAYKRWDAGWKNIRPANRSLIKSYILKNSDDRDAESIVSRG